jgi:hypothetical protein
VIFVAAVFQSARVTDGRPINDTHVQAYYYTSRQLGNKRNYKTKDKQGHPWWSMRVSLVVDITETQKTRDVTEAPQRTNKTGAVKSDCTHGNGKADIQNGVSSNNQPKKCAGKTRPADLPRFWFRSTGRLNGSVDL